jgi:membrane associated rhomboid family serine protease
MGLFLDAGELRRIQSLKAQRIRKAAAKDAELLSEIKAAARSKRELQQQQGGTIDIQGAWSSGNWLLGLLFDLAFLLDLPLEEDNTLRRTPYAVYGLITVTLGIWLWQAFLAPVKVWRGLMLVPSDILAGRHVYTLATSVFLHGGWVHVLGNLYFLWTFGDDVEDRVGRVSFLGWYLAWGLIAAFTSAALTPPGDRGIPQLGASGAISGAMGAYLVLFPRRRIVMWFGGYRVRGTILRISAWWYLGTWIALQIVSAMRNLPGVGWWAHIGGFAAGLAVGAVYRRSAQ